MLNNPENKWPVLKFEEMEPTLTTVHLWTQIIGKIRLKKMPWINHSWHVTLYVSSKGLTTGSVPYENGIFEIEMDFILHELNITSSEGRRETITFKNGTVADFYKELFHKLKHLGIPVHISGKPNEIESAIPFSEDNIARAYDPAQMNNYWKALICIEKVFTRFRSRFNGKVSPVHFFWGAFDLAVTRFSGRPAPLHPGGAPNMPDVIMQEAYSHEVSSCGFWPGNAGFPQPVFYSYCYPTPADFGSQPVQPAEAFYSQDMGEFFLRYEDVRNNADPETYLYQFLESTFQAAAKTADWHHQLQCNYSHLEKK
jgi:hypothetical protein